MWAKLKQGIIWRSRGGWITASGIAAAILALRFAGSLQLLEWAALDQFFRLRPPEPPDSRILLVTIGEADIKQKSWPASDAVLANLLNKIKQQQPRVIGMDIYRNIPIEPGHQDLIKVFESTPNLIGITKVVDIPLASSVDPPPTLKRLGQVSANDLVQDGDGKIRRSLLYLEDSQNETILTLGTSLALKYLEAENINLEPIENPKPGKGIFASLTENIKLQVLGPPEDLKLGKGILKSMGENDGSYIRLSDAGGYQILANFRSSHQKLHSVSMRDVLDGKISPNLMRDKIVLIGITAESLGDYFYTSYSSDPISRFSGVEVHAAIASQILSAALDGRPLLLVWQDPVEWLWILAWSGIGAILGWNLRPPAWTALRILLAAGSLIGGSYLLFLASWWIPLVPTLLVLVGSSVTSKGYILWHNLNLSYKELEEYSQTLEQKVSDRTIELSQKNEQLEEEIQERRRAELALSQSEQRLRDQNHVLLELARNKTLYRGDLNAALKELSEATAHTLAVERVSVWLYDDGGVKLRCVELFEQNPGPFTKGSELLVAEHPAYFEALQEDGLLIIDDTFNDSRTQDFSESYLAPLGVTSMLDAPIRLGGQIMGVLCLERIGHAHHWTLEEQNFAGSLADLASLAIEAFGRLRAEKALQAAEEKYRSIFENAVEGIFQTTVDGHYISANPALVRIYGYDSILDLFTSIADITQQLYVLPNRRAEFIHLIAEQGEITKFESQVYRKDGSIIWISENARAVSDEAGQLLYYEGIVEDITDRKLAEEALRIEQEKSERLLLNILPKAIAHQLKQGKTTIAESFENVTILFADIVGFTNMSSRLQPIELVTMLNEVFSTFDNLAEFYGLEKIKTIGDAYMVVAGLPIPREDHAEAIADMALTMQTVIEHIQARREESLQIRIGINTGVVVAGVIGKKKFIYDLWGDAVNIASRMESQGRPGEIQVTEATYERLKYKYECEEKGIMQVKGRGAMKTFFLNRRSIG